MRGRPSGPGAAPSSNASASAGGKRDEVGMEVRGDDGGRRKGGRGGGRGEVRDSSLLFWLQVIGVVAGITGVLTFLFSNMKHKANKATSLDSDSSIMRRATVEVNRWSKTGEMPTLGITRGKYGRNGKFCTFCGGDIEWCQKGLNETNTTTPPVELLPPGRLVTRVIGEKTLCWLWYSAAFYSRPTGGYEGIGVLRVGGVDSKNGLLKAFHKYEMEHGCEPFQTYPISLDLGDEQNCPDFRSARGADSSVLKNVLWFIKASNGSTGDHIQLARGDEVAKQEKLERECTGGPVICRTSISCPAPNVIASMNVRNIWIINGRKFDNRAYLLIASVEPLVVFYRMGHLRFSILPYSGTSDLDFNVHVTNPRFAANQTNNTNEFIKPFDALHEELERQYGADAASLKFASLKQSVMNAMLSVVYSIRGVIEKKEMWEVMQTEAGQNISRWENVKNAGYELRWSYLFMALDIAFDESGNAFVLDVNTGPSFYHKMDLPGWFRKERSIMIREAADIMQEITFKKVFARAHNSSGWELLQGLKLPSFWLPLYNEPAGGAAVGPLGTTLLQYGKCPELTKVSG